MNAINKKKSNPLIFSLTFRFGRSQLHVEGGLLDSCNLIHFTLSDAELDALAEDRRLPSVTDDADDPDAFVKAWLFTDPDDSARLNGRLGTVMNAQRIPGPDHNRASDAKEWSDNCAFPIYHKKLVVTKEFLCKSSIAHRIVFQRATDLVWVAPRVPHQVINLVPNLAEAVNVGNPVWNAVRGVYSPCHCTPPRGLGTQDFVHNRRAGVTFNPRRRRIYECSVGSCVSYFRTKAHIRSYVGWHVASGHPLHS